MKSKQNRIQRLLKIDSKSHRLKLFDRIKNLELECMYMQRYITNKGIAMDEDLINEFSTLSVNIDIQGEKDQSDNLPTNKEIQENYNSALIIHNKLSKISSPASPISIKYTEYTKGIFLEKNRVVNSLIWITLISLVSFIISDIFLDNPLDKTLVEEKPILRLLMILSASGLGAGFYALTTVRKYLVNRTYNPRYNTTYIIRFILGLTSGTIMACLFKDHDMAKEYSFSVEILAIVGGFSAEAVTIILKRISDILVTVFKGPDKSKEVDV